MKSSLVSLIFVYLACLAVALNAAADVYILEQHCNQFNEIIVEDVLTIRLSEKTTDFVGKCRTFLGFQSAHGNPLLVTFSKLNITEANPHGACVQHFVQIAGTSKQQIRLCDLANVSKLKQILIESDKKYDNHLYYFRNVNLTSDHEVELTVRPVFYAENGTSCSAQNHFECTSDKLCIPAVLKCDQQPNCADQSDERDCPSTTTASSSTDINRSSVDLVLEASGRVDREDGGQGSPKKTHIIVGVGGGILIIALVAAVAFIAVRRHQQRQHRFAQVSTSDKAESRKTNIKDEEEHINTTLQNPVESEV